MQRAAQSLLTFFNTYPQQSFNSGQSIISSNDEPSYFYFVESGSVKMMRTSIEGKNINLHLFFPGAFFPLLSLIEEQKNKYDFVAFTDTVVRVAPRVECMSFISANNEVLLETQEKLLRGLSGLLTRIELTVSQSAKQRVANLLIYFAKHFSEVSGEHGKQEITVKITHQEIADWLGLSRENVSIQMKQLEDEGYISLHDHRITLSSKFHTM